MKNLKLNNSKIKNKQIENAEVLFDIDNTIFISQKRLPCEQPFQRLQITYDGKVSMCCYDWGQVILLDMLMNWQ